MRAVARTCNGGGEGACMDNDLQRRRRFPNNYRFSSICFSRRLDR
jgi:hypothetical protein